MLPYPAWLNAGDNAWQLTAATLVGLMSVPGLVVLYGGVVQKKWAINTMLMAFTGFCIVLFVWVFWGFNMGFGHPWHPSVQASSSTTWSANRQSGALAGSELENQANIPLLSGRDCPPAGFHYDKASLIYFQFVFAAITPLLFLGSVLTRMSLKALDDLRRRYGLAGIPDQRLPDLGRRLLRHERRSGLLRWVRHPPCRRCRGLRRRRAVGPRIKGDRDATPNNMMMVALGAGFLWLGWNGFNGGDPYFAGADAGAAVLNTNLAAASAMFIWVMLDMLSPRKSASLIGAVNGMIVGLVGITPAAGFVNGYGALAIGVFGSAIVWTMMNYVGPKIPPFNRVDDALGVVWTHGLAGCSAACRSACSPTPR